MKKSIFCIGTLLLFSAALWSCSDDSDNNLEEDLSLVQLMEVKANALADAVVDISESKGFEIITIDDASMKMGGGQSDDSRYVMTITLNDIKGIYDYKKGLTEQQGITKYGYLKVFDKVADSESFILRLPKEKAMRPWKLYVDEDVEYVNDFVITTNEYNYSYLGGMQFDYLLNSEIEIEDEKAGELFVDWSISENMNFDYQSKFTFADDFSVGVEFGLNEMYSYAFNLMKGDDILFREEVEISKSDDTDKRELKYSLELGNIKIIWNSESESYVVYRNGELQEGAKIQVTHKYESDEAHVAFCRKGRDIKITFEDGTSIQLSELLTANTLELMNKIFSSMHDMKFVKHIVDKVAREVYYTNLASSNMN
ncbi:hypothetical protein DWB61_06595 [Ancylomarina euxinus]|uniref:Lipoprotein n=1 Tax=Ancylomarina euxinus TaxID=2283627 RepID=A0A425Y2W1_9BACT|nr:hypothetical protein [Ancylomarina euxinus]MCZ4693263.1 hypothetical protein [Ancylomarina euxinus]MUP16794.1 hypothetical protein [Ancylomarina euxinus]RRG22480.1 hypothetical protein DWB61_06595 [Ancylomarina euxinus]